MASICPVVEELYSSNFTLKFIYLAQFFLSIASLIIQLAVLLRLYLKGVNAFSRNLQLLLMSLTLALIGANMGTLLSCIYPLHVLLFRPAGAARCYWLSFSHVDCVWIKAIQQVCTYSIYAASCAIAIERVLTSLLYDDSRHNGKFGISAAIGGRKKWAILLIALQWFVAVCVMVVPNSSPTAASTAPTLALYPHCYAFIPSAIQQRHFFYLGLGMQLLALGICTTLTYHYSSGLVKRELAGTFSPLLYENVVHTGRALPSVLAVVAFFVVNCITDRNFIFYAASVVNGVEMPFTRDLLPNVYWSELQAFSIPLLSLALFAILFIQMSKFECGGGRVDPGDDLYERVASEFALCTVPTVDDLCDSRSGTDGTSQLSSDSGSPTSGKSGQLSCRKDVSGRLEMALSKPACSREEESANSGGANRLPNKPELSHTMAKRKLRKTDSISNNINDEVVAGIAYNIYDYESVRRSPGESVAKKTLADPS